MLSKLTKISLAITTRSRDVTCSLCNARNIFQADTLGLGAGFLKWFFSAAICYQNVLQSSNSRIKTCFQWTLRFIFSDRPFISLSSRNI